MAILIPSGQSFTNVGGMWKMLPAPGPFVLPDMRREGREINIYETAGVVNVTAQANLVCPGGTPGPSQPSPELITGISVSVYQPGVIVLKGGVSTIPEMRDGTDAVSMGSISVAPGVTTLVLPIPIIGNYTEKWLYDSEAGFIESYKGLEVPIAQDNVRSSSFFSGQGRVKPISQKMRTEPLIARKIPGTGARNFAYQNSVGRELYGPVGHDLAQQNSNYMWSYRPSLIKTLRYHYLITVTSTCPPYTWTFPAYVDVDNNWRHHKSRTLHRLSKQRTATTGIVGTTGGNP